MSLIRTSLVVACYLTAACLFLASMPMAATAWSCCATVFVLTAPSRDDG